MDWPEWWKWDLLLTRHIEKRMRDRNFTEADLRTMLESASGFAPNHVRGRWVVLAVHAAQPWHVIVEPDTRRRVLTIITAYPSSR